MLAPRQQTDWLYLLKRRILISVLLVLAVTILVTMVCIAYKLRDTLVEDTRTKSVELADTINSSLDHLMMLRAREAIQETLVRTEAHNDSITAIFILNTESEVVYSSRPAEIGQRIDRSADPTCRVCHSRAAEPPHPDTAVLDTNGSTLRNITLIQNAEPCHECHDSSRAINGKLVIDRSLADTYALITDIQLILGASGLICLVILVPVFSRLLGGGINRYIHEIFSRNEELRMLYALVERLSKTLDVDLLKAIVCDIFREVLDADEIEFLLARGDNEFSASEWSAATGKIERKNVAEDPALEKRLQAWLDGELNESAVSADGREICLPVTKGVHRLALIVARKKTGAFEPERLKLCPIVSSHIAVAFDNARLYYIAITDELTKTYTKRHFRHCIDEIFDDYEQYGSKFALLMMDLDKFKQVNDVHGHVVGDAVLRSLGEVIRRCVRENDQVFRYGGEEFAVILPETDAQGAHFVAERIRQTTAEERFEPGSLNLELTISIGIATCPTAESVHELIVAADQALYQAKRQGRNRVVIAEPTLPV